MLFFLIASHAPGVLAGPDTIDIKIGQGSYRVELALTSAQRRQGLMHRERLAHNGGMLLVYPRPGDHRIWMKNMKIPLRVLWIDEQFKVLQIRRLVPCEASPCPVFSAPLPARYILELSDDEHDVKPGDEIVGLNAL
ncbi:MAG: DUF192 domain-containing protein [Gammaproteobacteria bacterium]|nr:DUF192 domain-containing protein [Gammaproteobacteria bacterium]